MASLGSVPFSIDGAAEGSAYSAHRFLAANRRRTPFDYWGNGASKAGDSNLRSCTLRSGKLTRGLRRMEGFRWIINSVRKDFDGGQYENNSVDALQETIEKSKKVLAIQSEILQKIAERRKLLASLKNNISNPVNGSFHSDPDVSPNGRGKPDESYDIRAGSTTSTSHAVPNGASTDGHTFRRAAPSSSVSSKVSLKTSGFSTSSDNQGNLTEGGLSFQRAEEMDFSKSSRRTRVSAEFNKDYAYYEREEETSSLSDSGLSYSGSVVPKNSEASCIQHEQPEEGSISQLTNMNEPSPGDIKSCPPAGENAMNILLVAAECAPWSKTGGLGDVAAALPKALARRGHRVMVVAPRYGNYPEAQHLGLPRRYSANGQDFEVSYFHAYIDGVDYVFIDSDLFRGIEKNIYGGNRLDILKRMVLFCKAAIEVPWHVPCGGVCYGDGNLVFIANDWHTALLPVYLKAYYHEHGFMTYARSVLVIHNIAHQGRGPLEDFSYLDLPGHFLENFRVYDPVGGEHFNIFAAGLKLAHRIVTVSHGYAWELKTQEGGWGLHSIIQENDWKLKGIVNGIDANEWNPQSDIHLQSDGYKNYSLETLNIGKPQCKTALQKELNLPARPDTLLIGFIGRLDPQKGVDIIADAIPWMMEHDVQLVMLGTGNADLEQMLRHAESQHHDRVRGWVGFSVKTAHRITAGADVLLMPSRFEPCGLNQLYAMRYGTIPVVHAVGGLRDTVAPFDPYNDSGYGWTFEMADSDKMKEALWNCMVTYRHYKQSWEGIQRRGMKQNLSWDRAAQIYEEVVLDAKFQW